MSPPSPRHYDEVRVVLVTKDRVFVGTKDDDTRFLHLSMREAARLIARLAECLREVTPPPSNPERRL